MSGDERLRIEVLGPIRAYVADGRDVTPDGPLQRRLLALLVLRRGHVVSVDTAVDVLWPGRPPRDPVAALHNHLFRLRRGLPADVVESTGSGYRLSPQAIDLDADRLVAALNASDAVDAAALDEILDRWHGPAYPELDDVDDGRAEAVRLAELRIRATEARAAARIVTGASDDLITELAALADEEPLRERPRALLMEALARAGRNVEALRVYDDFRRLLGDELGIEPSPALIAQHADLLTGTGRATWSPASRLHTPVTSLVGRDELVDDVLAMAEANRLVTLSGPGGVGKSRLLDEVGLRLRGMHPDRPVVLCELAAADEGSAIDAVAAALGIEGRPDVGLVDRIAAVLGDTALVLLLDNCEHVLQPIAELVQSLLATCPNVRIITTSRERVRVIAEHVVAVPPLPTLSTSADDAPAVQLFVERARAVDPAFDPDPELLTVVSEIVRRLDGLPLAIELAAARLQTLEVTEVAAGLDHRFTLLSSGYRASARHGSLGAAMSWSYGLLDPRLQRIFADLSVFAGSFTVAEAAAISGTTVADASAALDQLTERSLVMRVPGRRYLLLETLRAFGAEQLAADRRADLAGERHARHYVQWIEAADRRMADPRHPTVLSDIDDALPELRSALGWLIDHEGVALAGRLVSALSDYGFMRVRPDVLAWSERVTEADPDDRSPLAPHVWAVSAYAAWMAGDVAKAGARSARSLVAAAPSGEVPAVVAMARGNYELFQGNLDKAVAWYRRATDAAADASQRLFAEGTGLLALGYAGDPAALDLSERLLADVGTAPTPQAAYIWFCAGEADLLFDPERAGARFAQALQLAERTRASFVAGLAGASKASIEARIGDPLVAADSYRQLLAQWRRAGFWSAQWTVLRSVAALLARLGRHREAAVLEGAVRSTPYGHRIFGADEAALNELSAQLRTVLGDETYDDARREGAVLDGDAAVEHALRAL